MPLRVLAVASEAFPLVKTGGLADVVGALPLALAAHDVAVTTLLPGYPQVLRAMGEAAAGLVLPDLFGGPARLVPVTADGLALIVLDAPHLFDRAGGPYAGLDGVAFGDNAIRFAALAAAAALVAGGGMPGYACDAVHAHDWQAGLTGAYIRLGGGRPVPVVFTVHNLAFQGQFPAALFPRLGLPPVAFRTEGLEYFGGVGYLKAGLWFADRITTVSPTYATEIRTADGGMGLDGLLRGRGTAVSGILNGIDVVSWNPAEDIALAANFTAATLAPRRRNTAALRARFGLAEDPAALVFGFIGRLAWQKGIDLVLEALPALLGAGAQLVILGSGEPELEGRCLGAMAANPGRIATFIGFDEGLARLCYGGADALLVPSRFEPCGLTQLCALRYGALPVVARTGGLTDTVIDANEVAVGAGVATGFQFAPGSIEMLSDAIRRADALWRDPPGWRRVQANAMATDVSWTRSAARYAGLFREVAAGHG